MKPARIKISASCITKAAPRSITLVSHVTEITPLANEPHKGPGDDNGAGFDVSARSTTLLYATLNFALAGCQNLSKI